jgi:hypothetical protein
MVSPKDEITQIWVQLARSTTFIMGVCSRVPVASPVGSCIGTLPAKAPLRIGQNFVWIPAHFAHDLNRTTTPTPPGNNQHYLVTRAAGVRK